MSTNKSNLKQVSEEFLIATLTTCKEEYLKKLIKTMLSCFKPSDPSSQNELFVNLSDKGLFRIINGLKEHPSAGNLIV